MSFLSKIKSSFGLSDENNKEKTLGIDVGINDVLRPTTPELDFWADFSSQVETWRELEALPFNNEVNFVLNKHFPKNVVVEVEGNPQKSDVRLVFSSNGEIEHFPAVMRLAQSAPAMRGFSACAFRQRTALNESMVFNMNGISLHVGELVAQYSADGGRIGLSLAFNKIIPAEQTDAYKHLAFILLDHLLGEWFLAVKVGFIEFIESPENFNKSLGVVVPLTELSEKLEQFWHKDLEHNEEFPKGDYAYALLEARGENQSPDEQGNIIISVNRSANSVACRADLMYRLSISGMLDDRETINRYYDLEEALSNALSTGEQGVFAYRETDKGNGHWHMYFYVFEAEMAKAVAQALVAKIFPPTSPVSVEYILEPRWLGYLRFS